MGIFIPKMSASECIIMSSSELLNHFKNVKTYIHSLPIQEQLAEVNKMIDYFSNYYHVWTNVKQQYAMIEQFKDFKRMIIAEHIEKLRDNINILNNHHHCTNYYRSDYFNITSWCKSQYW